MVYTESAPEGGTPYSCHGVATLCTRALQPRRPGVPTPVDDAHLGGQRLAHRVQTGAVETYRMVQYTSCDSLPVEAQWARLRAPKSGGLHSAVGNWGRAAGTQNFEWIAGLSTTEYQRDALIIAGDVAHKNDIVDNTLQLCVERFAAVFYCPGNHDLWVRRHAQLSPAVCAIKLRGNTIGGLAGFWLLQLLHLSLNEATWRSAHTTTTSSRPSPQSVLGFGSRA